MMLLSTLKGGVARAALQVIAPAAQTTRAPATIRFKVLRLMICPPTVCVGVKMPPPGAQTERRGEAGRVRGPPGEGLTGRFTSGYLIVMRGRLVTEESGFPSNTNQRPATANDCVPWSRPGRLGQGFARIPQVWVTP